jgi:dTMP kinase
MNVQMIILEGGEGAGKTTLAAALEDHFVTQGVDVLRTREPGGSVGAEEIRALLKKPDSTNQHVPEAHLLLHYAARFDHLKQTIIPALQQRKLVICDRFEVSSYAYQVHAMGVPKTLFIALHREVCTILRPHLSQAVYVHCELDAKIGLERAQQQLQLQVGEVVRTGDDAYDSLPLDFHESLRVGMKESKRYIDSSLFLHLHIDAGQSAVDVRAAALAALEPFC